jgi:hypothetical protein
MDSDVKDLGLLSCSVRDIFHMGLICTEMKDLALFSKEML